MHVFAFLSILYGKERVEAVCGTARAYGKSHRDWTVWSSDRTKSPSRQLVLKLRGDNVARKPFREVSPSGGRLPRTEAGERQREGWDS